MDPQSMLVHLSILGYHLLQRSLPLSTVQTCQKWTKQQRYNRITASKELNHKLQIPNLMRRKCSLQVLKNQTLTGLVRLCNQVNLHDRDTCPAKESVTTKPSYYVCTACCICPTHLFLEDLLSVHLKENVLIRNMTEKNGEQLTFPLCSTVFELLKLLKIIWKKMRRKKGQTAGSNWLQIRTPVERL
jgi:hypothetical protein